MSLPDKKILLQYSQLAGTVHATDFLLLYSPMVSYYCTKSIDSFQEEDAFISACLCIFK
jgi:hypothetical protein